MQAAAEIYHNYAQTNDGQKLNETPRFNKYRPDDVSVAEWRGMFGADVNNFQHNLLVHNVARYFVRQMAVQQPGFFTERTAYLFQLGAVIHDFPEAKVTDISFSDKNDADFELERTTFLEHAKSYCGDDEELAADVLEAGETIVFDKSPSNILNRGFNGVERVVYHRTALNANQLLVEGHKSGMPRLLKDKLHWLVGDVLSNNTKLLVEDSIIFKPIREYLIAQEAALTTAWEMIPADLATQFYGSLAADRQVKIDEGREAWEYWRKNIKPFQLQNR